MSGNGPDSLAAQAVIGSEIRVTTGGVTVQGKVYAFDPVTKCAVLSTELESGKHEVRFIPTEVKGDLKFELISKGSQQPLESLPAVNVHALEEREKKAEADARLAIECIGKNVSGEAQEIFDALRKTYPCRWQESLIIVLEQATVRPPYQKENCEGDPSVVERLKMVLDRYWTEKKTRTKE